MGETPKTVNETVAAVDKTGGAIIDGLIDLAIKAAQDQVPFLAAPIISTIFGAAVRWLFGKIKLPLLRMADFKIIAAQAEAEAKEYAKAKDALAAAQPDSEEEKRAYEEFKKSFQNLVHSNGS